MRLADIAMIQGNAALSVELERNSSAYLYNISFEALYAHLFLPQSFHWQLHSDETYKGYLYIYKIIRIGMNLMKK